MNTWTAWRLSRFTPVWLFATPWRYLISRSQYTYVVSGYHIGKHVFASSARASTCTSVAFLYRGTFSVSRNINLHSSVAFNRWKTCSTQPPVARSSMCFHLEALMHTIVPNGMLSFVRQASTLCYRRHEMVGIPRDEVLWGWQRFTDQERRLDFSPSVGVLIEQLFLRGHLRNQPIIVHIGVPRSQLYTIMCDTAFVYKFISCPWECCWTKHCRIIQHNRNYRLPSRFRGRNQDNLIQHLSWYPDLNLCDPGKSKAHPNTSILSSLEKPVKDYLIFGSANIQVCMLVTFQSHDVSIWDLTPKGCSSTFHFERGSFV